MMKFQTRLNVFLIVSVLLVMFPIISAREEEQRFMPGGYHPIENPNDERVTAAASFALQELQKDDSLGFSFMNKLINPSVVVVGGSQQVVAGMNYKLVLVLTEPNGTVIGGVTVTVYDRFGNLSVTKWGKEIPKSTAKSLLKNQEEFGNDWMGELFE